ncbi:hypothetical protein ACQ4LE_008568 [Meloidogyne hapla]
MKIIIFCLFAFLIIEGNIVNAANACKCSSELKTYCDAEFVAHVLVNTEQNTKYEIDVNVLRTYKSNNKIVDNNDKNNGDNIIMTDARGCEVKLENGKEYLIGGGYDNGNFYINKCNSIVKKWNEVTKVLNEGLRNGTLDCKK